VYELYYFDAGIAATSLAVDGRIVTNDQQLKRITEIESLWEEIQNS
jgi:predicted nucleic acid-binding protein